mgnify:CR=1 FL=1
MGNEIKRFSEALKKRIIEEIERGSVSLAEASSLYGCSKAVIKHWLSEYGKYRPQRSIVEVTMKDEKEKIEELQKALAEAHLKIRIYDKMFEQANKQYKIDLKKTFGTQALENLEEKGKKSK